MLCLFKSCITSFISCHNYFIGLSSRHSYKVLALTIYSVLYLLILFSPRLPYYFFQSSLLLFLPFVHPISLLHHSIFISLPSIHDFLPLLNFPCLFSLPLLVLRSYTQQIFTKILPNLPIIKVSFSSKCIIFIIDKKNNI